MLARLALIGALAAVARATCDDECRFATSCGLVAGSVPPMRRCVWATPGNQFAFVPPASALTIDFELKAGPGGAALFEPASAGVAPASGGEGQFTSARYTGAAQQYLITTSRAGITGGRQRIGLALQGGFAADSQGSGFSDVVISSGSGASGASVQGLSTGDQLVAGGVRGARRA